MSTAITKVERLSTKTTQLLNNDTDQDEQEAERLKRWLCILKIHTLDGVILALIDEALSGRNPLNEDYIKDKCHDNEM